MTQEKNPYHAFTSSTLCNKLDCQRIIGLFHNHTTIGTLHCGRVNAYTQIAGLKGTRREAQLKHCEGLRTPAEPGSRHILTADGNTRSLRYHSRKMGKNYVTALALCDLGGLVTTYTPVCHSLQAGDHSHCRGRCYTGTCTLSGDCSWQSHLSEGDFGGFASTRDCHIKKLDLDTIYTFFSIYHLQEKAIFN